ncbi:MAG: hypothetical protein II970_05375 [Paludibacteraceae bacterium]|nr:hypothetical protein [Paludibacteraceae bacterium]
MDVTVPVYAYTPGKASALTLTDYYTISVTSNDNTYGTVSGAGTYANGASQTLIASVTNSTLYEFKGWKKNGSSSYVSTSASYTVTVNAADSYVAEFAPKAATQYTINAESNNTTYGTVTGHGSYYGNNTAELSANSADALNYYFQEWQNKATSAQISTSNPYSFTVNATTSAITYKAIFATRDVVNITASDDMVLTKAGSFWSVAGAGTDNTNSYTMQIRFDAISLTGTFNSGVNTSETWVQKEGGSKIYAQSFSTATITEPSTGLLQIVATIIGTDQKKYVITGYYETPKTGAFATFSWDDPDDDITMGTYGDGDSYCTSYFSPYGKMFVEMIALNTTKTTNNIVKIYIQTTNTSTYSGITCAAAGTYPMASGLGTAVNSSCNGNPYWYWTMDQTNVAVPYAYDDYRLGVCNLSTYGRNYVGGSESGSYTTFNSKSVRVSAGRDGKPYVEIFDPSNGNLHVVIGAPKASRKVTIANPGSGKTITVKDAQNNTYATGSEHRITEGTVLTITVSTTDGTHITGWTGTNSGDVTPTGTANTYTLTIGAQSYNIAATFEGDTHAILWKSEDGTSTLETDNNVAHNGATTFDGTTPTKDTDDEFTYIFDGWTTLANGAGTYYADGSTPNATADANYFAHFGKKTNTYTVNFNGADANGSVTGKVKSTSASITTGDKQPYNTVLTFTATDIATGYEVDYWKNGDDQIAGSTGQASIDYTVGTSNDIKAVFKLKHYTITWKDGDGNTLDTDDVEHGSIPSYTGATTPTKTAITGYTYTFNGTWAPEIVAATAAAEYTAQFNPVANTYALTLDKGIDGTANGSATATYDSNTLTSVTDATKTTGSWTLNGYFTAATGGTKVINADGSLVTNASDANYTYTNGGQWKYTATSSLTLYAQWTENITYKTLSVNAQHGTVTVTGGTLSSEETGGKTYSVAVGSTVTLNAAVNTTPAVDKYFYEFKNWNVTAGGVTVTNSKFTMPDADVTLAAQFGIASTIVLKDGETDFYGAYSELVTTLKGAAVDVRLDRNGGLKKDTWSTICLPFDYNLEDTYFEGKIWTYQGATGDWENGLDLHFAKTGDMEANTPYLYYNTTAVSAEELLFDDVVLTDGTPKDIHGGSVTFKGVVQRTPLTGGENKNKLFLQDNMIYYLGSSGTVVRAYRAYFEVDEQDTPAGMQPRVRIVMHGNNATDIEVIDMDGGTQTRSNAEVRKYMENGILIIEREGVRYDATGAKIN